MLSVTSTKVQRSKYKDRFRQIFCAACFTSRERMRSPKRDFNFAQSLHQLNRLPFADAAAIDRFFRLAHQRLESDGRSSSSAPQRARQSPRADCCSRRRHSAPALSGCANRYFQSPDRKRARAAAVPPLTPQTPDSTGDQPAATATAGQTGGRASKASAVSAELSDRRLPAPECRQSNLQTRCGCAAALVKLIEGNQAIRSLPADLSPACRLSFKTNAAIGDDERIAQQNDPALAVRVIKQQRALGGEAR